MSDIGEMVFLPSLMERVHALAPRLQVEVVEVPLEQLPQALKDGEIDTAIGNWPAWAATRAMPTCSASATPAWAVAAIPCWRPA